MPTKPRITLWVEGIIVFFATPGQDHCTFGVLSNLATHTFLIEVWETFDNGGRRLKTRLGRNEIGNNRVYLHVPPAVGTVQFSRGPVFDRNSPATEADDLRWALDLQYDLYNEDIRIDHQACQPYIRVNAGGTYFASRVSLDEVARVEIDEAGSQIGQPERIGRVATAIGGHIYLTQNPNRPAILYFGEIAINLPFPRGQSYEIRITHASGLDPTPTNDAITYEQVIPSAASMRKLRIRRHGNAAPGDFGSGDPHGTCLIPRVALQHEPPPLPQ